ncbi:MAG: patatin family protein [Candidatus Cryptobacteroides sp.]
MKQETNTGAQRRPKIGLVLEGGGMRGLYTAGVLDVFMDHSFRADTICGTSAGVTFGINLPSGQRGRVLRYNLRLIGDPRYISFKSLFRTGDIVNADFAYRILPDELDPFDYETFAKSGVDFFACATNALTGEPEYMKITDAKAQMDIVRASASLPFLSRKVFIGDIPYLDGGISDNIPLDKCMSEGCDKIIVVLTHPKGYVKTERLYLLSRLFYPCSKRLQEAFRLRNQRYNDRLRQIEELESEGRIFVLRPSGNIDVARLEKDRSKLKAAYSLGIRDARSMWSSLCGYLEMAAEGADV